jgi:hypothetical protein
VGPSGETRFIPSGATPIDLQGNSLSGYSDAIVLADYAAFDGWVFGNNRYSPEDFNEYALPHLPPSFAKSTDQQVTDALMRDWPVDFILNSTNNTIVPIQFSDGTRALFQVNVGPPWHVYWIAAWDSHNNPIKRDGTPIINANTSGNGGGSISVTGFGSAGNWSWTVNGEQMCQWTDVVTFEGEVLGTTTSTGPC